MAKHEQFNIKNLKMLQEKLTALNLDLPILEDPSVLFTPLRLLNGLIAVNRFAVQPMEGFDGEADGTPSELTFRRYGRYARGGSAVIWFEACTVVPEGRSNPAQLYLHPKNISVFQKLIDDTRNEAIKTFGAEQRLILILQLTHSGRYAKPDGKPAPIIAHHSPILDPLQHLPKDYPVVSDAYLDQLQDRFVEAATLAQQAGFDGVDIKSCHGYLLSELLASFTRENSRYGGDYPNRTRMLREICQRVSREVPGVFVTTRMNVMDTIPAPYGFGMKAGKDLILDFEEPLKLIGELKELGMPVINQSISNPYYQPHWGRPYDIGTKGAVLPDSHPLENVTKIIQITRQVHNHYPDLPVIGSGYSWLRQFIPVIAAGVISNGWASMIGLGRSSFAYPEAVKELKEKGSFDKAKVCVACSACTQLMQDGGHTGCVVRDHEIYSLKHRKTTTDAGNSE